MYQGLALDWPVERWTVELQLEIREVRFPIGRAFDVLKLFHVYARVRSDTFARRKTSIVENVPEQRYKKLQKRINNSVVLMPLHSLGVANEFEDLWETPPDQSMF